MRNSNLPQQATKKEQTITRPKQPEQSVRLFEDKMKTKSDNPTISSYYSEIPLHACGFHRSI